MAFVYKAERVIKMSHNEGAKNQNLGPGSYSVNKPPPKSNNYFSKPPFQTQTGRCGTNDQNRKSHDMTNIGVATAANNAMTFDNKSRGVTQGRQQVQQHQTDRFGYTPGPGSYNVTNGFDQINRDMQSAKTLQGFGLDQFGIQFVKPHTSFASRVKRFQGGQLGPQNKEVVAPGPGQYFQEQDWGKKRGGQGTAGGWNVHQGQQVVTKPCPPSIPSHEFVFGYEENAQGKLICQKNSEQVHTGVKADTVGPGEYEVIGKKGKNSTKWGFGSEKRSTDPVNKKKKDVPGPGHYQAATSTNNPIYKNNKSSVFASSVPRTASSATGRTRVKVISQKDQKASVGKYAAIARAAASPKGVRDILESDDDDQTPGPGQYYKPSQSTFKPETKPQRLQFFGSTVERFNVQSKVVGGVSENIGPGTYPVPTNQFATTSKTVKSVVPQKPHIGFQSGQNRFEEANAALGPTQSLKTQKLMTPGPGTYVEHNDLHMQVMKKTADPRKNGTFGCTEKRFAARAGALVQNTEIPGPGSYIQPNQEKMQQEGVKRSSSMFISKTKRNSTYHNIQQKAKLNPGIERVCYDDRSGTIADVVKKRVDQINNPLLASLTTKNNTTMAFSSNAPRFNRKIMDEETYIGPGYYEQKSCFEKSRSTQKSTNKTQTALAGARSMQQMSLLSQPLKAKGVPVAGMRQANPGQLNTPGPGHYSQPDLNRWFKRSYNMNFSDV